MRTSEPFWCCLAPCTAVALTATLIFSDVRAAGVAVLKEQTFHRDSSAKAVTYLRIIDSHGPYLRIVNGSRNIDIQRSKMVNHIEVPDQIPQTILEEKDLADLRESLAEMTKFSTRYPHSAQLLESLIAALSGHLARFDAGEVRFEGDWMTRAELVEVRESQQRIAEIRRRHEIEQLVFDEAQQENGLVLVDGKWMTEQEARERPPSARSELSDAIWPLINPEIEGARITLQNLSTLAARQNGIIKVRTERLHSVIKNLFIAEFQLSRQTIAFNAAAAQAAAHERHAKHWLKPNGFGTIRKDAARDSQERAMAVRSQANQQLAACHEQLLTQLHEAAIVSDDFRKLHEHRVALTLEKTVRKIAARRIPGGEFHPSFTDKINLGKTASKSTLSANYLPR